MNISLIVKFAAGALLYGLWGALVFTGHAPADSLITAIAGGIAGLGVHGATVHSSATQSRVTIPAKEVPQSATAIVTKS